MSDSITPEGWHQSPFRNISLKRRQRYIDGITPLPKRYRIGPPCKNGHQYKGQTIYYTQQGRCVECVRKEGREREHKKLKTSSDSHMKALRVFEETQNKNDEDPLFD